MPSLADVTFNSLYCMFTGEPGSRKSTHALSFPKPIYFFDCDKKIDALYSPAIRWGINLKDDVKFDTYNDYSAMRSQLERFQRECKFKTIVIDSITSTADNIGMQTRTLKSGTVGKSGEEKGNRVAGIAVNTIEDYKAEASAFSELLALTKDIQQFHKCNIILIAHVVGERMNVDANSRSARIIATGSKQISAKLPAYCSEIYHFQVDKGLGSQEDKYEILTQHSGLDFARTSLNLERKLVLEGNDALYEKYIKPAIAKITTQPSTIRI